MHDFLSAYVDWFIAALVLSSEVLKGSSNKKMFLYAWYLGLLNCSLFTFMAVEDSRPGVIVLNILLSIVFIRHIIYWSESS